MMRSCGGVVLAALSLIASTQALATSAQATAAQATAAQATAAQATAAQATAAQATAAQATVDCPGDPGIDHDIELKVDIPEPRLHHDLGIAELNRKAPRGPGHRVLGLADTGLEFGWAVRFEWQPRGAG